MTRHPADLTVAEAGRALRGGLTAEVLLRAHLERIAERDGEIGAFVHLAGDAALAAAARVDAERAAGVDRGPLHGIPFAVKDVVDVEGWPVRRGSAVFAGRIADRTARCVLDMVAAGAIPLGLVATYELATVGPDPGALYPPARNPRDPSRITGGSSSGSAAAVAGGLVRIAIGTDTAGSIRGPAAYCGAVGLKPTHGRLSLEGVMPLAPSLDVVGPMGARVGDVAAAFAALSGTPPPADTGISGTTLAHARNWCREDAHAALLPTMDGAASILSMAGARIAPTALPPYARVEAAAAAVLFAEQRASMSAALEDGGRLVGPMALASLSTPPPSADELNRARRVIAAFDAAIEEVLAGADALILPTVMTPAPPVSAFANGAAAWTPMRTIPFSATGHPAVSVPMTRAEGLPLGLQIVGRRGGEWTILALAAAFEDRLPYPA